MPPPLPEPISDRVRPSDEAAATATVLLVAGFGDPVAADYADWARCHGKHRVVLIAADTSPPALADAATALVVFLKPGLSRNERPAIEALFQLAGRNRVQFVEIVSTFRVDLGDRAAAEVEAEVTALARRLGVGVRIFRPGHLLSANSSATARLRRFAFAYSLVPSWLTGCCVEADELFRAIDHEHYLGGSRGPRALTILGPQRPWRAWLADHRANGWWHACLTWACTIVALLGLGYLAGIVLAVLARRRPSWRCGNVGTLTPSSFRDLLALVNPYNIDHVKVVGYNNGVVHFGHRYPDRTIVSTVGCNRIRLLAGGTFKADCGTTVRQAHDVLSAAGRELPVAPNYSYVCLGTAYFVPIHGSASDFSTIADTITRVVLYDPRQDRIIAADRADPAFRDHVYHPCTDVLLLRLYVQVKPKSPYRVQVETVFKPPSSVLVDALNDRRASNVEIRKANAASDHVTVCRYYGANGTGPAAGLELPRDTLGGLWDRLEENPVTSFLMHALARHAIWHVELFFTVEEFAVFWETHRTLPLRKLQMRAIRRDGMPHSPFRDHDVVSVDLFMLRRRRRTFAAYLWQTFRTVKCNPGKHSR